MEFFEQLYIQFKAIYSKMSVSQRVSFALIVGSIVIFLITVFVWSSKPDYVVLFSDLSTDDAAKIYTKLEEYEIPYKVTGNVIKVPSQYVYETRLKLANEGLPKGKNVGYEIFDKTTLGQTDYLQRLNFQRALEGELSRTISSIDVIDYARVHLVMPKPTIFSDKEKKVTASIVLTTRGRHLSKDKVTAITHLVSSSVEGLDPGDVTIIDDNGNLLSGASEPNVAVSMTASQLEIQKNIENYLESKVSTLLSGVLGPGKSIVRVTADLDFSQNEKTKETYNPESQVARSENRVEETSKISSDSNSTVEKVITNYEIDKTVEHIIGATGKIARLSIAVVMDGKYEVEGVGKEKTKKYIARTEEEKDDIRKLVMTSIGLNKERGDSIEVINIPFDKSYLEEEQVEIEKLRRAENMERIAKAVGPWVVVLLVFGALFVTLQKIITQASLAKVSIVGSGAAPHPGIAKPGFEKRGGVDTDALYEQMRQEEIEALERAEAEAMAEQMLRERMEEEIASIATANPDAVAKIIKTWLEEG